ncbi:unnamed protein product (macronuclear) [Paramecium tetraurelia]|uniref:H-type lectin domain-containing protein n=1 Tax=Paramecium tetraurelia TaxID=5888 RepID=A0DR55_PARTE|nr:uncharacterized protein GSPATT00002923001 [Paramecium tetraurelia]CAK85522.1 unnamed protein product [Paramecium tetraurelia]|eukprot:XP_001452919.1 hypothetical protein (macronuclear) [Paramecium tetraurelia strain d4-2]
MIILKITSAYIYSDTGVFNGFATASDSTFICNFGFSRTATISYSNQFERIPQVFFVHEYLEQEKADMGFRLSITTITQTDFTLEISCHKQRQYTLRIRWFAIDDQLTSIWMFQMTRHFQLKIQMPKLVLWQSQVCVIQKQSIFYYLQLLVIYSLISEIKTNSVTVSITKIAGKFTNLKQIGYFVVVGIQDAFINLGLKTATGAFSSGTIPIEPNRWFAIALQGLAFPNTKNLRIRATYSNTATTISYTWGTWYEIETPNSHSQIWIAYQFTTIFKPLECFSIRISRKQVLDLLTLPTLYLELLQTNQIYTAIGNYEYLVDKTITPLKMNIQIKCQNGMKVQADFNKCNACNTKKTHSFTYNCFNQMNYIGFFPLFQQAFPQYNSLKIKLQSTTLEISQVVYDQSLTESTIVKIQILNQ